MSDKDNKNELNSSLLVADVMLRITALEKLLIDKGVFTKQELNATTEEIAKKVAKVVLDKVQASKNLETFVKDLEATSTSEKKGPTN